MVGLKRKRRDEMRQRVEEYRQLAHVLIKHVYKKGTLPKQLWPLPWDEELDLKTYFDENKDYFDNKLTPINKKYETREGVIQHT